MEIYYENMEIDEQRNEGLSEMLHKYPVVENRLKIVLVCLSKIKAN